MAGISCHIRVIYHIPMLAMGMICINARHHNDLLIHLRSSLRAFSDDFAPLICVRESRN